jgi:biotin transport system substrate-specific component
MGFGQRSVDGVLIQHGDCIPEPAGAATDSGVHHRALLVLSVLGCCLMVSVSAQVRVPVPGSDVPMTLQPLAVLLTGFLLPPARAAGAMLLYLLLGAAGMPVFAPGSAGLGGATGGYLAGFLAGAWLVSMVAGGREAGFRRLVLAGTVGILSIFALGTMWRMVLALSFGWFGGDLLPAVATGVLPFIAKGAVELALAVMLVVSVRRWRGGGQRRKAL